jgi:fructokinase
LWDMLPGGARPGGAPMNVAIHLKRLGMDPLLVSSVGKDPRGEKLLQFLNTSHLNMRYVQQDKNLPTSKVLVLLDEKKNATYEICEPVAWDHILPVDELDGLAKKAGLIIFGSLASRHSVTRETLLQILGRSSAMRLLDVNLRPPYDKPEVLVPLLHAADLVKLNEEELSGIAGWYDRKGNERELVMWLARKFDCRSVCVTRGARGAALFAEDKWYEHPGFKVKAVDTVGAGDAFLAGLVARLSDGTSPEQALEFACATGAYVASQAGAVPEYVQEDIDFFLK